VKGREKRKPKCVLKHKQSADCLPAVMCSCNSSIVH